MQEGVTNYDGIKTSTLAYAHFPQHAHPLVFIVK